MKIKRIKIFYKIILTFLIVMIFPTIGLMFLLNHLVESNVNQRIEDRLRYGKNYLISIIDSNILDVKTSSIRLTSDVNMLNILTHINARRNYDKKMMVEIMAEYNTPFIEIYDSSFKSVLAESFGQYYDMNDFFFSPRIQKEKLLYIKKSKDQQDVSLHEYIIPEGILCYSIIPIKERGLYNKSNIQNYIVIGKVIDTNVFYNFKKILNQEFDLLDSKQVRIISTQFDDFGENLAGTLLTDEHIVSIFHGEGKGEEGDIIAVSTVNPAYKSLYFPYYGADGTLHAGIISQDISDIARGNARPYLFALAIAIFILIIIASLFLNRQIVSPINLLLEGITEVSNRLAEDLPFEKIHIHTNDEISALAEAYNTMGENLFRYANYLEDMIQDKTAMNERLKQFDKLKDDFLANTSHELRTPLSGIIGISESLIDGIAGQLPEIARQNISIILASTKRLSSLVNDILDFYKMKNQQIELSLKAIDLHSMIHIVLAIFAPLVAKKNVVLINDIPKNLPPVEADENRLEQIFYNIIGNGIKFTSEGQVSISARQTGQAIEITVSDTGIGIPAEKINEIFNSFEQVHGSVERTYGGTGLGLAITKQLIELHNSTIKVKSEVNRGSSFSFKLAVSKEEVITEEQKAAAISDYHPDEIEILEHIDEYVNQESRINNSGQYKILVVDDEIINIQVLDNLLSLRNYSVIKAVSGFDALEHIDKHGIPNLVLLDVMMPRMSGFELCRRLRQDYASSELPIILITAKTRIGDLVSGFDSGANDYLTKPFVKNELISRIETQIKIVEQQKKLKDTERLKKEMEIAQQIQTAIVSLPSAHKDMDIVAAMIPAEKVGGDYYDVTYDSKNTLWFAIGDVSGHGLTPGLIMMMAQSSFASIINETDTVTPAGAIVSVNRFLYHNITERLHGEYYMTMTFLQYAGEGRFIHAGAHVPIIVYRAAEKRCELVETKGLFLGMIPDISHITVNSEFSLKKDDLMMLYTDGVIEARNENDELFDLKNVQDILTGFAGQNLNTIKETLINRVFEWCLHEPKDDITVVLVRKK